jgi:hypothetical protein
LNIFILAGAIITALVAVFYGVRLISVAFGKQQFAGEWGAFTAMLLVAVGASVSYWLFSLIIK